MLAQGNYQSSKFEVWFLLNTYHFHTNIKSKNFKSNQYKLETVCSYHLWDLEQVTLLFMGQFLHLYNYSNIIYFDRLLYRTEKIHI